MSCLARDEQMIMSCVPKPLPTPQHQEEEEEEEDY